MLQVVKIRVNEVALFTRASREQAPWVLLRHKSSDSIFIAIHTDMVKVGQPFCSEEDI